MALGLRVSQHMFLYFPDHEAPAKHFVNGVMREGGVAEPHRAVGEARALRHQVEQVVAGLRVLGAAKKNTLRDMIILLKNVSIDFAFISTKVRFEL